MIDVNTTSKYSTHFLRAVELIIKARSDYNIPSENWTYPTRYKFGIPNDNYYAEIWTDGMDWQPSYWVIEELDLDKPVVKPLIVFETNEDRQEFNEYDFEAFINAMLYYRRDKYWIKRNDYGYYTDAIWPYLKRTDEKRPKHSVMKKYLFQHASQPKVEFWLNQHFVPEAYYEKRVLRRKQ